MNNRIIKISFTGILFICIFITPAYPQSDIQREVRVVKPYSPTLSDAEKLNLLPDMRDTVQVRPDFNYTIVPKRFITPYQLEQIKPARMVGLPLEKLYKSQLTIGMGNYLTPLAELSVNQLRSRKSAMGMYLKHHSSGGNVTLDNNEKVFAGFSDNVVDLYGKWFLRNTVLEADLNGGYLISHYYGYNPVIDTTLEKGDIMQSIVTAGTKLRYYSSHIDSTRLNHHSGAGYKFSMDRFDNTEHAFSMHTNLMKKLGDQNAGSYIGFEHYNVSSSIDSSANTIISFSPFVSKRGNEWMFLVGANLAADARNDDVELKIYPKAEFEFHIVKDVLTPYMGVDGKREVNNYSKLLNENAFIVPGLSVKNTNHGIIGHAGLRGRYSSRMAFNLKGSYSIIKDMLFYVNDTSELLANRFSADIDDVLLTTITGEVSWNQSEKLKFLLKAWYYNYELEKLLHPWHKPEVEILFGTSYNLRDKILIDSDLFFTGKRYAQSAVTGDPVELKAYLDANLKVEYRYTKLLSFFLRFNNFSASQYHKWNQYPVQRFQFMAGFSYAL